MALRRQYLLRFCLRCAVFAAGAAMYFACPQYLPYLLCLYAADILLCALPVPARPKGSRKMFARYYCPKPYAPAALRAWKRRQDARAALMMAIWLAANAAAYALYFTRLVRAQEMYMLSLLFYIGDYICILWWCPFQRLVMKNRCCATCRIFRWDTFFLVTPLALLPGWIPKALFLLGAAVSAAWEIHYHRHPERFWEGANRALGCAGCTEGLCRGARQRGQT